MFLKNLGSIPFNLIACLTEGFLKGSSTYHIHRNSLGGDSGDCQKFEILFTLSKTKVGKRSKQRDNFIFDLVLKMFVLK